MMNNLTIMLSTQHRACGLRCIFGLLLVLGSSCDASTKDAPGDSSGGSSNMSMATTTVGATTDSRVESSGESSGGNPNCEQHFDRASCNAESDQCEFFGGGAQFTDGVCTLNDDIGWCLSPPFGGATVPSMWYEANTGRVVGLSFDPISGPPGWVQCGTACNSENQPVEPCLSCFCADAPDDE